MANLDAGRVYKASELEAILGQQSMSREFKRLVSELNVFTFRMPRWLAPGSWLYGANKFYSSLPTSDIRKKVMERLRNASEVQPVLDAVGVNWTALRDVTGKDVVNKTRYAILTRAVSEKWGVEHKVEANVNYYRRGRGGPSVSRSNSASSLRQESPRMMQPSSSVNRVEPALQDFGAETSGVGEMRSEHEHEDGDEEEEIESEESSSEQEETSEEIEESSESDLYESLESSSPESSYDSTSSQEVKRYRLKRLRDELELPKQKGIVVPAVAEERGRVMQIGQLRFADVKLTGLRAVLAGRSKESGWSVFEPQKRGDSGLLSLAGMLRSESTSSSRPGPCQVRSRSLRVTPWLGEAGADCFCTEATSIRMRSRRLIWKLIRVLLRGVRLCRRRRMVRVQLCRPR